MVSSIVARGQNVDNVSQGTSYLTIQDAIDDATAGESLELVAASFNEEVTVDRDIVIFGDGTTILSSPGVAVFDLDAGVSFELSGVLVEPVVGDLDMQGIVAGLGGNTITLSDATFTTSDPTVSGSALSVRSWVSVTITNVVFRNLVPGTDAAVNGVNPEVNPEVRPGLD